MFSNHFIEQSELLEKSLEKAVTKYLSKKSTNSVEKEKDLRVYEGVYQFLQKHLPENCSLSSGRIRNQKQILKKNCDVVLYRKWCESYLEMTGGYVLSEDLYAFMSLEMDLNIQNLSNHINLTKATKTLYTNFENDKVHVIIPLYSIFFSYNTDLSLTQIKKELNKVIEKKEIALNQQLDLICILNHGLIIKDWENGGTYRGIQTGKDTLMWFFVILTEYLDQKERTSISFRDYIKEGREYSEI